MFKGLDKDKLTSPSQNAIVFSYGGASVEGILKRLQTDNKFAGIDKTNVTKIVLLCGTNNVDQILGVKSDNYTNFIQNYKPSSHYLKKTKSDIKKLVDYLHEYAPAASIKLTNILPRESAVRNLVINELNFYLKELCKSSNFLKFISTEVNRNLFTFNNGNRKNIFFSTWGLDNVHLNEVNVIRLAKHIKYHAHLD